MREKFNIRIVLLVFFLGIVFVLNLTKISDPDFFWHLKTGEVIAASGAPAQDSYSWTHGGKKWLDHEWLSQLILHAVFQTTGFAAIILLKAAFITGAFFLVFLACLKLSASFEISIFISALGAAASSLTYSARPWMFSFFLLAALLLILYGEKTRLIRAVPLLFVLWINLHGMFIIGAVVLAVFTADDVIRRRKFSALAVIALVAAAAILLNPYGIRAVLHPFKYLYGSTHMHMSYIMEWMSPDFHSAHGKALILFVSLTLLSFIFSPEKPAVRDLFLYFSFLAASLCSARNTPLFIIVSSPPAAKHMALALKDFLKRLSGSSAQAVAKSKTLYALNYFLVAALAFTVFSAYRKNFRDGYLQENELPVKAAAEIARLKPSRILNPYHWGGYLIYSGVEVFIDGRADFYPGEFLEDFFQSTGLLKNPADFFSRYEFDYIIWEKNSPLTFYISNSPEWELLYSDEVSVIYRRRNFLGDGRIKNRGYTDPTADA